MVVDKSIYNGIVRYIYETELKNNPYYEINKDIKIHDIKVGEFNYSVEYSIEYISVRDSYWRKWNTKDIHIDIDGMDFIICLRDTKIDSVLKKDDN